MRRAVCFWMLCALFNEAKILERGVRGEVTRRVRRSRPVAKPGLQEGSVTTTFVFIDGNGRGIAVAHCYVQPDGSIGYSGDHDPKWLRLGSQEYVPAHERD